MNERLKRRFTPVLFLLPAFSFLAIFTYYPIFFAGYTSLYQWSIAYTSKVFAGLQNYLDLLSEPRFGTVLRNTAIYSLTTISLGMLGGLTLALQVNKRIRGSDFFKVSLFYPTMIPSVSAGLVWLWIYAPNYGLLDNILRPFGISDFVPLYSPNTALFCIIVVGIWKQVGYYTILFLAGLQNVPEELYDAARIEGAGRWVRLRRIILPLISSYTFFIFIINIVDSLQSVDFVYVMTQGKPGHSTDVIVFYIYEQAFKYFNMGMGSTLTTLLSLFLLACVALVFLTFGKRVYYEV